MNTRIAIAVGICVAFAAVAWTAYWAGYARAVAASRLSSYDEAMTSALMSLQLRQVMLKNEPSGGCELDLFVAGRMQELELRESDLSGGPPLTLRDIVFGLRDLDATIRVKRRPSVEQVREKFSWSDSAAQACESIG